MWKEMKLVPFLIYIMLLPDKETIFSHDFLELSKNAFIEKRKKTGSNFVNFPKVGVHGALPRGASLKMQGCTSVRQGIWQSINIWTGVKKKRRIRTHA